MRQVGKMDAPTAGIAEVEVGIWSQLRRHQKSVGLFRYNPATDTDEQNILKYENYFPKFCIRNRILNTTAYIGESVRTKFF
jgi:hypothetical protein